MQNNWIGSILVSIGFTAMLSACSSGGNEAQPIMETPPVTGTAEGVWKGTTSNDRTIAGVIADDGSYWFMYSSVGDQTKLGGGIHGYAQAQNGSFSSNSAVDFVLDYGARLTGTLTGNYLPGEQLTGTFVVNNEETTFTFTPYTEITAPSDVWAIPAVVGIYPGSAELGGSVQGSAWLQVRENGDILIQNNTGGSYWEWLVQSCTRDGRVGQLRERGPGFVYDVSLWTLCPGSTLQYFGKAVYDPSTKRLAILAHDQGDRAKVFLFSGIKNAL